MPYHVYHTEAIILGGRPVGEGDRILFCYTRELGLVKASAKSLREGRSKLRYVLQTFAHVEIDLIRGKNGWKLISAKPVNSFAALWRHPGKRRILAEHWHLLRRLIHGEEGHHILFDDLLLGLEFLHDINDEAELRAAELLFVVRVLAHLGYWGTDERFTSLFAENAWNKEMLSVAHDSRVPLLAGVNQALTASNL